MSATARKPRYSQQYGVSTLLEARVRALLAGGKLPPGELQGLDAVEKYQRAVLLHQAAQHGPIFKVVAWGKFWVCVIGLPLGRKLLKEHGDSMSPVTIDIETMVPAGFMRQMSGETHQKYRTRLARALAREDVDGKQPVLERIAAELLASHAAGQVTAGNKATAYKRTLESIVAGMLIHIVFGAEPGTQFHVQLMRGFSELGPHGSTWTQGERQQRAFADIRRLALARCGQLSQGGPEGSGGLMSQLVKEGDLDDTMLGNLIFMVEMGRDDATGLFRWLSRYACHRPDLMEMIAGEAGESSGSPHARSPSEALVLETLRSDQSSRLLRVVERTISFGGYVIPRNTLLRICLWESHRAEETFDKPFEFSPERFVDRQYRADEFSPFGLDRHHCPFAGVTIAIACAFLRALAREYRISASHDGDPMMGPYFWEPAREFAVDLHERQPNP